MEIMEVLKKCELCERSGERLSLLSANHKEHGWIKICRDCWTNLYSKNRIVAGSSGSNNGSGSACNSCQRCSFR